MSGPLAGVKVLDFAWALVGSVTTKILADAGADVIKVETSTRPCLTRIDVQVKASSPKSFDDKPWYAHLNTSKRSLRLDIKHPGHRRVLDPLIDWADLVVENFSPGTMDKLGLGYAALKARRPDIVMVSGSVYGQTGPMSQMWGIDGTGAALSGRLLLTGYPDRPPVTPGAVPYGDVVLPYLMAGAAAAALEQRRRTGEGCWIDASMYEACVQQMSPALAAAQAGAPLARRGNRDASVLHQGVYPAAGEDRWIAITCFDATDWERLTASVGGAWPSADAVAAMDDAALDALDARLAAWTREEVDADLAARLQAAGIAAGAVNSIEETIVDPQLTARGALTEIDHAVLGRFGHQRTPISLSRTPLETRRAPSLGEHSAEISQTIAALSPDDVAALQADGMYT